MNRTIKEELLDHLSIQSLEDGWEKIERAVWIYNYERPHMSLGMLTPDKAHTGKAAIKKYWKKEMVLSGYRLTVLQRKNGWKTQI